MVRLLPHKATKTTALPQSTAKWSWVFFIAQNRSDANAHNSVFILQLLRNEFIVSRSAQNIKHSSKVAEFFAVRTFATNSYSG